MDTTTDDTILISSIKKILIDLLRSMLSIKSSFHNSKKFL